uniref:Kinesin-like protein KIF26B n=1 Tax=Pundamilia nyererei TaxID=303518 RepID=A0A3B4GZ97_9CICH
KDRQPKERPSPVGAGGSRGDPYRNMCQRADDVPSYKSLPGSVGDRIRTTMSFRTICRGGSMSANPGFGRSDRKVARCEKCSATLVALKKQALSLADLSDLSAFLHENLRVHSRSTTDFRERDQGECGACGANLYQLKQEAIHVALSRGQALAKPSFEASLSTGSLEALDQSHTPQSPRSPRTPQRTPQTLRRRGPKLPNPDMGRWVEEQQQLVASKSASRANGVTTNPYRQKLSLTLRKKGHASDPAPSQLSTCFREIIQKNPPPVPTCLLQAHIKLICTTLKRINCQPPVLRIDPSKKRVTIVEPVTKSHQRATMTLGRDGKSQLKTFTFDSAYPQESSQAEVCAGVLADVIRCVLSGSDACVLGLGCADVGSWSSMVGSGENIGKLGLIPCAISWLYSAIERRRERTWTDLSVSVSAIELCCGEEDTLRDLLGEVVPSLGSIHDSPKAHIKVQEDPVYGVQVELKAPTAERAASLLDAAVAARRHSDFITYLCDSSIMFFTLHVQPPRTESSTIGKGCSSRGATKLTMIDVCSGMRGVNKNKPPHSELGPIVLSLLSGQKSTANKSGKLTLLLRESLGHTNCHTTVIAQIMDSLAHLQENFSTIQLASRFRRTQKRTKSFSLRAFHSTDEVDVDIRPFRLRDELDERSSSEQSCDTVIQIDSDGSVHPRSAPRQAQPEFVPIIPSLHPNKADLDDPEFAALLQEKQPERDCLKCDTFAQLQERLGCIDGSEMTMDVLRSSLKGACLNNVTVKSQHPEESVKRADTEAPQTLLNKGLSCSQTSAGEKQTDGAGDSFQREDSGLYDCEECSATSSSEELLNQTLGLNATCRSEPSNTRTLKSGNGVSSKRFNVEAKVTAGASSLALEPSHKQDRAETADWFKTDKRTSPVGKSSPISPSSTCSSSHSLAKSVVLGDVLNSHPKQDVKEMKATITVTVQQPLDLKGQDELVFSMVEEVTISGAYDRARTGGNIICIRDGAHSQAHAEDSASSQPIQIISNVSEESAAPGSSGAPESSAAHPAGTEKSQHQVRREKRVLPSFINPMLINTDLDCDLDCAKDNESHCETLAGVRSESESKRNTARCSEDREVLQEKCAPVASQKHVKKTDKSCSQMSYEPVVLEHFSFCNKPPDNKTCEQTNTDKAHPRDRGHVYSSNTAELSEGTEITCRDTPKRTGESPGCQETILCSYSTGSLPRAWQSAKHQDAHLVDSRGLTSSTPCSPRVTLERRKARQHSPTNHNLYISSPQRYGTDFKQDPGATFRKGIGSVIDKSTSAVKRDNTSRRLRSPMEESGRLFSAKLQQLARRTSSLGRIPRDFPALERGGSNASVSSRGSSRGSTEGACKHIHSKLSAVGKLKTSSPKVRRSSAPSIKNPGVSHKTLQDSINHSASLRTPSQSSTSSSTKSAIQGFVNGRLSDFLKERAPSPTTGGSDQTTSLPSPYSQLTSPRMPDHLSGHASDTTSVLSGDLPPAMGKTSLHFSNRNSLVSSGYDSMVRDSEATGSSTSARDSVSDRSASLLSNQEKSTNMCTQQRHLSHDSPLTLRRSASGLRSRWMDQGIPEAYEIKVYEIDNVQRMQERAGAGKQGPTCFSAKLKLLEHRQQRISEVRAKYNNLRRELELAKRRLMLEPATWNHEFDLWQTFEVDSLEHLEALELVTARLERKVSLCKANVMMVTCFDGVSRRRCSFHKKGILCHQ